ncbi:ribbon-helix-helix protein, CopG family [Rhodococcus globerulus]|uniref:ribbon-helix-helix protein, CopG family n=1 Tax=Rhodococcus globerulus TaxID=33008 RepID=UPI00374FC51E
MPSLTIRIDDKTRIELDVLAKSSGQTVSDLVRGLIDQRLGCGIRVREGDTPASLAPIECPILAQHREILASLTDGGDEKLGAPPE